jgi:purine-nucleoside phosphorylase
MDAYVMRIRESAEWIRKWTGNSNDVDLAIICGSGLGECLANLLDNGHKSVSFEEVPHFPVSKVTGHAGKLLFGSVMGQSCLVMQGRAHYYEGYEMQEVVLPVRVFAKLGVKRLIITNACGSINTDVKTGDIVIIKDHVAFPCMSGLSPLRGDNYPEGERFPGMTHLWHQPPVEFDSHLKTATYGFISGPQFETPAEVRAMRILGVDVVGMSTVPEAIAAKHARIPVVIGVGLVTNECVTGNKQTPHEPTHKEVLINSKRSGDRFAKQVMQIIDLVSKP